MSTDLDFKHVFKKVWYFFGVPVDCSDEHRKVDSNCVVSCEQYVENSLDGECRAGNHSKPLFRQLRSVLEDMIGAQNEKCMRAHTSSAWKVLLIFFRTYVRVAVVINAVMKSTI